MGLPVMIIYAVARTTRHSLWAGVQGHKGAHAYTCAHSYMHEPVFTRKPKTLLTKTLERRRRRSYRTKREKGDDRFN